MGRQVVKALATVVKCHYWFLGTVENCKEYLEILLMVRKEQQSVIYFHRCSPAVSVAPGVPDALSHP